MTKANRARIWFWPSGGIAAVSLIVCSYLTWTAPQQPEPATGRVHRLALKGSSPRYVTGREEMLYVASSLVSLVSAFVFAKCKQEIDEEAQKEREALERGNMLGLRS